MLPTRAGYHPAMIATRLPWLLDIVRADGEVGDDFAESLNPGLRQHVDAFRDGIRKRAQQLTGGVLDGIDQRDPLRALASITTPDGVAWSVGMSVEPDAPHRISYLWIAGRKGHDGRHTLDTERLHLRPVEEQDFETYVEMEADEDVMRWIGKGGAQDRDSARLSFEYMYWLRDRFGFGGFAVIERETGEFLGRAFIGPLLDEIEVGYCFVKPAWGRGIATEAARAVVEWGFDDVKLERIVGITYPDNLASQRVLEKCGLVRDADKEIIGHTFHHFTRDAR